MEKMKQVIIDCLREAFKVQESLGAEGEQEVRKNQFGNTALKADIESEEAVFRVLRKHNIPIRAYSEEHGIVDISANPRYLGILDGLDGSDVYKKARGKGRYATMLGVFDNISPFYKDYLVSGVIEHASNRLFIAVKGEGASVVQNNISKPIHGSGKTVLDKQVKIYIDEPWEVNRETFLKKLGDFKTDYVGCSAAYYVDVASGAADLALECTRKKNLEIAVSYGLEKEAGAVMVDLEGQDIGNRKYLDFGQNEHMPIVTASTKELALNLIEYIKGK